MRVAASLMGLREFVPAHYTVPEMPIVGTDWPPVTNAGLAEFVAANFALPQQPAGLGRLADFVGAKFAVPGYFGDSGLGDLVDTAPMYPLHDNSVLEEARNLGMAGLAAGSDCGCGCNGHGGCGGGMSGLGDFSSFISDQMNKIAAGDVATIAMWGGGALLVAFFLFGTRKGGRSAYRSKKAELRKEYSEKLRAIRASSPTTAGRLIHAGRAARAAF